MDVEQLQAEVERLNRDRLLLESEKQALAIRAEGVEFLSQMLKQTQREANELRERLASRLGDDVCGGTAQANPAVPVGGSLEKSKSENPRDVSLWNTIDAAALDERQKELGSLLHRNKHLALELESTVKGQEKKSGDDRVLAEELCRWKPELKQYEARMQEESGLSSELKEETDRLKNKLTSIAVQRGTACGKLQKEIDFLKLKLIELESRIPSSKSDSESYLRNEADTPVISHPPSPPLSSADPASLEIVNAMTEKCDKASDFVDQRGNVPVVKPRTDVKEMKEKLETLTQENKELKKIVDDLNCQKAEIIKVNHAWDARYKKLKENFRNEMKERDHSYQKLQRNLSLDHRNVDASVKDLLNQKDNYIEEQSTQIRALQEELEKCRSESFNVNPSLVSRDLEAKYRQAKRLFLEQKSEKEIIIKKEEALQEECQVLKDAVDILERESRLLVNRNRTLREEIQRLTTVISSFPFEQTRSSPSSLLDTENHGFFRQASVVSDEQIEVLKQQIAIYAEDFNSEKEEKEKLARQVNQLNAKVMEIKRKCQSLENELRKKEEILQAMQYRTRYQPQDIYDDLLGPDYRKVIRQPVSPNQEAPRHFESPEEAMSFRDYQQLLEEKYRIKEKMAVLERAGSDRYNQRGHNYYGDLHLVGRGQTQSGMGAQSSEGNSDHDMYTSGNVVKDSGKVPLRVRILDYIHGFDGFGTEATNNDTDTLNQQ